MKRVLIVDSNEDFRIYLHKELIKNYEVHHCGSSNQAVRMIQELLPDALIINLAIRDPNGLTILQQTKYKPQAIVALTNMFNPFIADRAAALGIRAIFIYPCSMKAVAARLDALLCARI